MFGLHALYLVQSIAIDPYNIICCYNNIIILLYYVLKIIVLCYIPIYAYGQPLWYNSCVVTQTYITYIRRNGVNMALAAIVYKKIAGMITKKRDQTYSTTMKWIRFHLSIALLRSAVMCLRGNKSRIGHPIN